MLIINFQISKGMGWVGWGGLSGTCALLPLPTISDPLGSLLRPLNWGSQVTLGGPVMESIHPSFKCLTVILENFHMYTYSHFLISVTYLYTYYLYLYCATSKKNPYLSFSIVILIYLHGWIFICVLLLRMTLNIVCKL